MTKKLLFPLLFAATSAMGHAPACKQEDPRRWFVDANVGYFYPFSRPLRDVIPGGANYELQLTYKWNAHWGAFVEGDFFYNTGRSTGSHAKTYFWMLPVSAGLKWFGRLWASENFTRVVQGTVFIGPRWYYVHSTNASSSVDHHTHGHGWGGVGGLGLSYLRGHLTLSAMASASFGTIHTHSHKPNVKAPKTQVGGFVIGGGIGWNY
jgi:hypothetical protein